MQAIHNQYMHDVLKALVVSKSKPIEGRGA